MGTVLAIFIQGLSYGLIFFLLAAGMTLTMGLMRIVNMSHGALYMVGAYIGLKVYEVTNRNYVLAVLGGAAAAGVLGMLMEVGFLRRLYKKESSQVLVTIGFIYILQNLVMWVFGTFPLMAPMPDLFLMSVPVGDIYINYYRFFIIGFGLVMALLLWLLQDKSRLGARVRAGMDNREIAGALGINLRVLFTGVFALGSLVAGLCGVVGSPLTGVSYMVGWSALLYALIVVVIGGTGSIQGALVGGVLLGLVNAFGAAYFSRFSDFLMYGLLIVILLFRPSGLLGRKMAGHGGDHDLEKASPAKKKRKSVLAAKPVLTRAETTGAKARLHRLIPYLFVLAVLTIVPPFTSEFTQGVLASVLIYAIFAMSLDLIMGYTGLISFGHAVYFAFGGYAIGLLMVKVGITSFWILLPAAIGITAIAAAIIGYICLRVSGVYFLLVTMAFGQLLTAASTKWTSLTGGTDGLPGIDFPSLGFSFEWTDLNFYYFAFALFVVTYIVLHRVANSSFGRTLVGIRDNEPRMRSLGYNTWAIKYVAVIIAGAFAAIAGALYAWEYGSIFPHNFALEMSALPMLMVIMGGGATLWGPFLGAVVITLAQQYAAIYFFDRWPLVLGILFVLCVMFLPNGFAPYFTRMWDRMGINRPKAVSTAEGPEITGSEVEA